MSGTIISMIIQLVVGAVGGHAAGGAVKNAHLGAAGNTVAGALGGVAGGQLIQALVPAFEHAASTGNFSLGSIIGQVIASGAGGAILTAVVGLLKNMMAAKQ